MENLLKGVMDQITSSDGRTDFVRKVALATVGVIGSNREVIGPRKKRIYCTAWLSLDINNLRIRS